MGKHTPAPWRIDDEWIRPRVVADGIGVVAIMAEHDIGQQEWDQDEANAALIAAAPDLLAACKQVLASYERGGVIARADVAGAVLAAVEKAEGRA